MMAMFKLFFPVKPVIDEIQQLRLKKSDFEIRKTIGRGHFGEVCSINCLRLVLNTIKQQWKVFSMSDFASSKISHDI